MNTQILDQAKKLCVQDQIDLVEALWDEIAHRNAIPPPTEVQIAELERRLADYAANPEDVVSWDQVKAEARFYIRQ
jgi:putative addiction module component (TIGR02574 family)